RLAPGLESHFFAGGRRPAPTRRADRGPQDADLDLYGYGGDAEELLLVRDGTQEIWVPYAGETPEEGEGLIAEARDLPEEEEAAAEAAPEEGGSRPGLRRLLVGLLVIGGLAAIFWLPEARTGWNGLGKDTRAQATARFSREASVVAGKPVTIRCDESGDYVGAVQHAAGVAQVGGAPAPLTPGAR